MSEESPERMSRADFLKSVGKSVILVGAGAAGYASWNKLTSKIKVEAKQGTGRYPGSPWFAMAIDIEKCIGCGMCVKACSEENEVPPEHYRTWIERYVIKKDGSVEVSSPSGGINGFEGQLPDDEVERTFFVPKLCNHCDDSPCTQVCPVGATFRSPEGAVLIDYDYCVGCRYCIQACPYGSRFWNPQKKTADKCTMCYHRITKGQKPACVEICPVGARVFGDLSDPESPVSTFIRQNAVMVLKPHLKTGAKLFYKGLSREVV